MSPSEPIDLLPDSPRHRRSMVDCQIRTFDVTDARVIARFMDVPREIFLPALWRDLAYSDRALDIKADPFGATSRHLLPPLVLARLLQGASIKPTDKVLDVASGTGYTAALAAGLADAVTALESDGAFVPFIDNNMRACDVQNAQAVKGPLKDGYAKNAPYDVIIVNGAIEAETGNLFHQLNEGGRLLAIQRVPADPSGRASKAVRFEKRAGDISSRVLFDASAALLSEFCQSPQFVF